VIKKKLASLLILAENIYNIDKIGVLLSVLNLLKVLIDRYKLKIYKSIGVKRTLITIIEYIFIDGRYLNPLIIWSTAIYRST
jgi:Na+-transporting NADH:ubiquinone oxidoreductase subunit NqrE